MNRRVGLLIMLVSVIMISLVAISAEAAPSFAATATNCPITVTNTNDTGAGSLRQAVADLCDGGTITFDPTLNGQTITLANEIEITKLMTISAASTGPSTRSGGVSGRAETLNITISGNSITRHFIVQAAGELTLDRMTLRDGSADSGAAIRNLGTLTLTQSTVISNAAPLGDGGAIFNDGTATIENTTIANNTARRGGAIFNASDRLTIRDSQITENSTQFSGGGIRLDEDGIVVIHNSEILSNTGTVGGGIFVNSRDTLTLTQSTVSHNSATERGGGLFIAGLTKIEQSTIANNNANGNGGGIQFDPTSPTNRFTLVNSTVSSNEARSNSVGSGIDADGDFEILNSTIVSNTGANAGINLRAGALITLTNSIVADNATADCVSVDNLFNVSHSLIKDGGCGIVDGVDGNLAADPLLAPLADNGGSTFTHLPLNSSLALNAADGAVCPAVDQRDLPRLVETCDSGAVEVCSALVENNNDDGAGSLRAAVASVESCGGGVITFAPNMAGETITLISRIDVSLPVFISAETLTDTLTISGGSATSLFQARPTGELTLAHLRIIDGESTVGVNTGGTLIVDHVYFASNFNSTILNSGQAFVTNSTFFDNNTGPGGDGTIRNSGTLTVTNTLFKDNDSRRGAGIFNGDTGVAKVTNSTFSGGFSTNGTKRGAGIHNRGDVTVTHSTFVGNRTPDGTLDNLSGTMTLFNIVLADNVDSCRGTINVSVGNWVDDNDCDADFNGDPMLAPLGDYGGATETYALLLNSGLHQAVSANCVATDGRGVARGATCDIGAYESQGYQINVVFGDGQLTETNTPFADPLVVEVLAIDANDPISGFVTFNAPEMGASLVTTEFTATIDATGNAASGVISANNIEGLYSVVGSAEGANSAEFDLENTAPPTSCDDVITVTNGNDSGPDSLRQAVADLCDDGTILFANALTVELATQINIDKRVTIEAEDHAVTLSGEDVTRVFEVEETGALTLSHVTVANGFVVGSGGAVKNFGDLTVLFSLFSNNEATSFGGAISNSGGAEALTIVDSPLSGGANSSGSGRSLTIIDSTFSMNVAGSEGGVIDNESSAEIINAHFISNTANTGGAISNFGGNMTLETVTIDGNNAVIGGGGLLNSGILNATNIIISNNYAVGNGGGISNTVSASFVLMNSIVDGNSADENGGGIVTNGGTFIAKNVTVSNNTALGNGGGLFSLFFDSCPPNHIDNRISRRSALRSAGCRSSTPRSGDPIEFLDSVIVGNQAQNGAGIFNSYFATVVRTTIKDNTATNNGGGIVVDAFAFSGVRDSTITNNSANLSGGIRANSNSSLIVENSTISGNTAQSQANGIMVLGSADIINSTIVGNDSTINTPSLRLGADSTTTVKNSIIADNANGDCTSANSATVTISHSLVETTGCDIENGLEGNIIAPALLGPLAFNGGATQTHDLLAGSPAINSAEQATCDAFPINGIDQRGADRGSDCDMGAVEAGATVPSAILLSKISAVSGNFLWMVLLPLVFLTLGVIVRQWQSRPTT